METKGFRNACKTVVLTAATLMILFALALTNAYAADDSAVGLDTNPYGDANSIVIDGGSAGNYHFANPIMTVPDYLEGRIALSTAKDIKGNRLSVWGKKDGTSSFESMSDISQKGCNYYLETVIRVTDDTLYAQILDHYFRLVPILFKVDGKYFKLHDLSNLGTLYDYSQALDPDVLKGFRYRSETFRVNQPSYTVSVYDSIEAAKPYQKLTVPDGGSVSESEIQAPPAREGLHFMGWYTSKDRLKGNLETGKGDQFAFGGALHGDVTLYPLWGADVKIDVEGNGTVSCQILNPKGGAVRHSISYKSWPDDLTSITVSNTASGTVSYELPKGEWDEAFVPVHTAPKQFDGKPDIYDKDAGTYFALSSINDNIKPDEGWVFRGFRINGGELIPWKTASFCYPNSKSNSYDYYIPVDKDISITIVFQENPKVTLHANGGEFADGSTEKTGIEPYNTTYRTFQNYTAAEFYAKYGKPTRPDGKNFVGWYTTPTLEPGTIQKFPVTIEDDLELYAAYANRVTLLSTSSVYYESNDTWVVTSKSPLIDGIGGNVKVWMDDISGWAPMQYQTTDDSLQEVRVKAEPKEGYVFKGWYLDDARRTNGAPTGALLSRELEISVPGPVSGDKYVYGWFVPARTVTFDDGFSGNSTYGNGTIEGGMAPVTTGYSMEYEVPEPAYVTTGTAAVGDWIFDGWKIKGDASGTVYKPASLKGDGSNDSAASDITGDVITISDSITLEAQWTHRSVAVRYIDGVTGKYVNTTYGVNARVDESAGTITETLTDHIYQLAANGYIREDGEILPLSSGVEDNYFQFTHPAIAGSLVTRPTFNTTRPGHTYTFEGFYADKAYTEEFDFEHTQVREDTVIYLHYEKSAMVKASASPSVGGLIQIDGYSELTEDERGFLAGETIRIKAIPNEEDGYEFIEWRRLSADGDPFSEEAEIEVTAGQDVASFVAVFRKIDEHTVTFLSVEDGETTMLSEQTVREGKPAVKPADPVREYFDFTGWFTDKACKEAYDFSSPVSSELTIYAGWDHADHHVLIKVDAKAPTASEPGNIEHYLCTVCEEIFKDENGQEPLTESDVTIAPAGGGNSGGENKDGGNSGGENKDGGNSGGENKGGKNGGAKITPPPQDPAKQKGEDGTAVGKGASEVAANKAITSIKNDEGPAGTVFNGLQLKASKVTKTSIKLSWKKVSGAKKYILYANKCGKTNKYKKLTTLTKTSYTVKKANGSKLKKGTYYKFILVAVDKNGNVLSTSKSVHAATSGGKAGNAGKVTTKAKKNKVSLKAKKTFKLGAKEVVSSKKLKISKHRRIKYESTNPKVASVSAKGVIKGVKKGTCYVYAYAQNGVCAKVKVTVK